MARISSLSEIQLGPLLQEVTEIAVRNNIRVPASLALTGKAFAQMQPSDTKQAKSRKPEPKPQRKSRIARRYVPPHFTSAPQWQFGWFGQSPWRGG